MPMIQGIDGSALLAAFRQGRSDRASDDKAQAEKARTEQIGGLMAQMFPGQSGGGVAGQYARGGIVATPQQEAQTASLESQFPGRTPTDASPGPVVAPQPAPQAPAQRMAAPDPNILAKLTILDPETGGKLATAFKTMADTDLQHHQTRNDMLGAAAHFLERYPPDQRHHMMEIVAPQLLQAGWTPQEIEQADLSDNGLKGYQAVAIDFDKMIDNELAERKYQSGDNVSIQAGGNVVNVKPDGSARYVVAQPGVADSGASGGIPPEAIAALKSGEGTPEQFDAIFGAGAAARIMGGGASNGTGGFPG